MKDLESSTELDDVLDGMDRRIMAAQTLCRYVDRLVRDSRPDSVLRVATIDIDELAPSAVKEQLGHRRKNFTLALADVTNLLRPRQSPATLLALTKLIETRLEATIDAPLDDLIGVAASTRRLLGAGARLKRVRRARTQMDAICSLLERAFASEPMLDSIRVFRGTATDRLDQLENATKMRLKADHSPDLKAVVAHSDERRLRLAARNALPGLHTGDFAAVAEAFHSARSANESIQKLAALEPALERAWPRLIEEGTFSIEDRQVIAEALTTLGMAGRVVDPEAVVAIASGGELIQAERVVSMRRARMQRGTALQGTQGIEAKGTPALER